MTDPIPSSEPSPVPDPCGYFCNATWDRLGLTPKNNLPPCVHPKGSHYDIDGENVACTECEELADTTSDSEPSPVGVESESVVIPADHARMFALSVMVAANNLDARWSNTVTVLRELQRRLSVAFPREETTNGK